MLSYNKEHDVNSLDNAKVYHNYYYFLVVVAGAAAAVAAAVVVKEIFENV